MNITTEDLKELYKKFNEVYYNLYNCLPERVKLLENGNLESIHNAYDIIHHELSISGLSKDIKELKIIQDEKLKLEKIEYNKKITEMLKFNRLKEKEKRKIEYEKLKQEFEL